MSAPFREFALRSRRVLSSHTGPDRPATVLIRGGRISAVEPYDLRPGEVPVEDCGDLVVMPGIVDTHAHVNEPGRTEWEGFETATRAAAAGGITTLIDMPLNSIPATTTAAALKAKDDAARGRCSVDYGFWGGVIPGNAGELEPMVDAGIMGFKAFLIDSGVAEFPMARESDLRVAMPILARRNVPLLVHAELDCGAPASNAGGHDRSYEGYVRSRPSRWEVEAVRMMIRLVRETRCPVHIVHLSAADALPDLAAARAEGLPITVETCPHYLSFCAEEIADGATHFKCAPPIRERDNRERLWEALAAGHIDFIVSDHSPCTPALKRLDTGEFAHAWGGISGLQFSLPAIWTEAGHRGHSVQDIVRWMCTNTARFAGLQGRKGAIEPGCDADLVIWDPDRSYRLTRDMVRHRHPLTPYEGRTLYGVVEKTYVRGECVHGAGAVLAPTGIRLQPAPRGKVST